MCFGIIPAVDSSRTCSPHCRRWVLRQAGFSATGLPAAIDLYSFAIPRSTIRVTVIIPTLNEAARIRTAVEALSWADEVIVADGGSKDRTRELAREAGAKVIDARGGSIASQRNAGIAKARNYWILALDIDETVPDELRDEIGAVVETPRHEAYRIRFRNFYLGREIHHGRWGNEYHVRLFRSDRRFQERSVHETLEAVTDVGSLRAPIKHSPYRDFSHHLDEDGSLRSLGRTGSFSSRVSIRLCTVDVSPCMALYPRVHFLRWMERRAGWITPGSSKCVLGTTQVRSSSGARVAESDPNGAGRAARPTSASRPRNATRRVARNFGFLNMTPPC